MYNIEYVQRGFWKERCNLYNIYSSVFLPYIQMISPGFQRSLSAGEVAGLCYGLVMDARYCRLCLGAGCFLGPGFVFSLGDSLLVSIYSSAPRDFLSITWGSCWWSRCVFLLGYERALRSSFGPLGFGLKWGFTFVPRVFVLISSCARLLCLFFLRFFHLIPRGEISFHQDDESAGSWFIGP